MENLNQKINELAKFLRIDLETLYESKDLDHYIKQKIDDHVSRYHEDFEDFIDRVHDEGRVNTN